MENLQLVLPPSVTRGAFAHKSTRANIKPDIDLPSAHSQERTVNGNTTWSDCQGTRTGRTHHAVVFTDAR
eukprot:1177131-Prorocentrum_minimum.AAC.1